MVVLFVQKLWEVFSKPRDILLFILEKNRTSVTFVVEDSLKKAVSILTRNSYILTIDILGKNHMSLISSLIPFSKSKQTEFMSDH